MTDFKVNEKDFRILKCAQPDGMGYMNDDRALELMKLGLINRVPKSQWHKAGYKATEKGIEVFNRWVVEMRQKHGHVWLTNRESDPDLYEEDSEYANKINGSAFNEGYHNGPKCKNCGFEFCEHCFLEEELPVCSEKSKGKTMSDDDKLDRTTVAMDKAVRSSMGLRT